MSLNEIPYNKMTLAEKLQNYIEKNMECKEFEAIPCRDYDSIHFKIQHRFTSNDLKAMFSYWGLNWKDWVWEWHTLPKSHISIVINLFYYHDKDKTKCAHQFKEVSGWGVYLICNSCGLFRDNNGVDIKKMEVKKDRK